MPWVKKSVKAADGEAFSAASAWAMTSPPSAPARTFEKAACWMSSI
jgi:hypothetical protein